MKTGFGNHLFFLFLATLVAGCAEQQIGAVAADSEPNLQSDADTVILRDKSGAVLTAECGNRALNVWLTAGTTKDFATPVRIRFIGGEADEHFRRLTEIAPDEEDYWSFDSEKGSFEVSFPIAFLEALTKADHVFLDLKISEQERKAIVFDVPEMEKSILSSSLERNRIRVRNELRALGLDQASTHNELNLVKPNPLDVGLDEETILVLYEEYVILLGYLRDKNVVPIPTAEDSRAIEASSDPVRPVTGMVKYCRKNYPDSMARLEAIAIDRGFESLDQWAAIGDRVQMGMGAQTVENVKAGIIAEMRGHSRAEIEAFNESKRKLVEVMQAFSQREIDWFAENHARFNSAL